MKLLSINFGFNGSMTLMDDGKIIRHMSFSKLNFKNGGRNIISDKTFANIFYGTNIVLSDIDYMVFVGFDRSKFRYTELDFVPEDGYKINHSSLYVNPRLERAPVRKLMSLLPPYTERPYDYIKGHFLFKEYITPAFIVSPDIAYTSFGFFSSNFNKSLTITVNSNDSNPYDGSLITMAKSDNISVIQRPKISVGKLYPKITELLGFGLGGVNYTTLQDISTRYFTPKHLEDVKDEGVNNSLSDIKDNYELSFFFEHSNNQYYQDINKYKDIPYSSYSVDDINSKYVLKTASMTQRVIENTVIGLIGDTLEKYSGKFTHNLVLSGDVFENRRLNTKILQTFSDVIIHIAPYNRPETMSLGGALYVNSLLGKRRSYSRDFLLSTSPYKFDVTNNGDDIDFKLLDTYLKESMVAYINKSPEATQKSMGYSGILFDVDSKGYIDMKDVMLKNPYEKPILLIKEDKFLNHFNDIPYTLDNNTVAKPKSPHIFKNFIHDDGYLNVFVVNEETNKDICNILEGLEIDYLGYYNFTTKNTNHIFLYKSMFKIMAELNIKYLLLDNKQHIN